MCYNRAMLNDRKVIACNLTESTSEFSKGALAYVYLANRDNAGERIEIYGRSRGGRWILKWEALFRLGNFRLKTIPPEHPKYHYQEIDACDYSAMIDTADNIISDYNKWSDEARTHRKANPATNNPHP